MRRINFQLPKNLAIRFEEEAFRAGVTKAKLLRGWINEFDNNDVLLTQVYSETESTTFNMRVDDVVFEKILAISYGTGIKQSEVLRKVVAKNLQGILLNSSYTELWKYGDLRNIYRIEDKLFESLSFQERLNYLRLQVEKGDFYDVENKLDGLGDEVWKLIILGDLQTYCFGGDSMRVLDKMQKVELKNLDAQRLAEFKRSKGRLHFVLDNLNGAESSMSSAYEYFVQLRDEIGLINTMMYLSSIHNYQLRTELSQGYGSMLKNLIENSQNVHFISRGYHNLSINEFRRGELDNAENYENIGLEISNQNNSGVGKVYGHDNLAWIAFFKNNRDKCKKHVRIMNSTNSLSFVKQRKWHSDVLSSFVDGKKFKNIGKLATLRRCVTKYLDVAQDYVNREPSGQSVESLRQMEGETNLPILKKAVRYTLETRQLAVFR